MPSIGEPAEAPDPVVVPAFPPDPALPPDPVVPPVVEDTPPMSSESGGAMSEQPTSNAPMPGSEAKSRHVRRADTRSIIANGLVLVPDPGFSNPNWLKTLTSVAPRAHLSLAGLRDSLTPVAGLDVVDRELTRLYADLGHPDRWKLLRYDVQHQETPEGRQAILAFLRQQL